MNTSLVRRNLVLAFLLLSAGTNCYSQLAINTALTPTQLVQNVLVGGGVTVSNVTMTGLPTMYGSFSNGAATNLGFGSGVLLTTGNITDVAQAASGFMSTDMGQAGDPDLNNIGSAGTTTYDACVLQFDFVPQDDTVKFRYVFGSEEYPEYVNSTFNDLFGFFINGPNPSGGNYTNQNIALIPGSMTYVSINNVNDGYSASCTSPGSGCTNCTYYVNNCSGGTIVFDGFTGVLTAKAPVTPCQTYHMKLAVADVGDGIYDSGVFLEANSFSTSGVSVGTSYSNALFGNNAIEGCSNGAFGFSLPAPATTPVTINYTVQGTATNGTDYAAIPTSVTIPVGSDSVSVVISPFADGITEGTESVIIGVTNVCTTVYDTVYITDNVPLNVTASGTTTICPGGSATLTAAATNGITPYTYNWNNGAGTGTPVTVSPGSNTTYVVTVSDYCNQTATDDAVVTVANNLTVTATPPNPFICLGGNVVLTASGASNYTWAPGTGLSGTTGASVTASPAATSIYTVTGTSGGCSGSAQVTVNVGSSLNITVTPNTPSICPGASVQLTANGGLTYAWSGTGLSGTTGTTVTANPIITTVYSVTGTDASGCSGSTTVTVNVSPISATASATDENCGQANGSLSATASGNCNTTFTYAWNTIPAQFTQNVNNVSQGTYTVTVSCGACTTTATATINNLPGPSVSFSSITNATCSLPNGSATASPTGGNPPFTYQWNSSPAQYSATLSNVTAGAYNVTLTDANNCTAVNTVTITNTPGPSAAVTGINDASCGMSDGSAQLTVNAGTQPFSYNWNSMPVQTGQNLQNVPMGNYSVTVTDANSCTATANVTVGQTGGPTATATSTNEICNQANGTATVIAQNGSGTYTYLWSNGQVTSTATGLAAGNYTVTVDDGACTTIATAGVMNIPGPTAGFSAHPTVVTPMDGPVSFLDNSSGNIVNWQWNFGDGSAPGSGETTTHPFENIGQYLVTLIVTDNNGCMDTVVDTIKVKEIFTFYIPNAFTPNGDGYNDFFTPRGLSVDPDHFDMQIFDRWGNLVFHTNKWLINTAEPWNGTQNNKGTIDDVVMDVYVYRIRLKEIDGPKHDYVGRIALIP
jgi:gliding motility-associated-like protein